MSHRARWRDAGTRGASRVLVSAVLGLLMMLGIPLAAAADPSSGTIAAVSASSAEQPETPNAPDKTKSKNKTPTKPAGPKIPPAETEQDQDESNRELVMGISSAVLIGIVVWGRSVRRKRRKAAEG